MVAFCRTISNLEVPNISVGTVCSTVRNYPLATDERGGHRRIKDAGPGVASLAEVRAYFFGNRAVGAIGGSFNRARKEKPGVSPGQRLLGGIELGPYTAGPVGSLIILGILGYALAQGVYQFAPFYAVHETKPRLLLRRKAFVFGGDHHLRRHRRLGTKLGGGHFLAAL